MAGNGQVPNTAIQLVITFDQMTGAINVSGPVDNAFVCYGMLEMAKDAVRKKMLERNESRIHLAGVVPIAGA
jgi:hypothetical protein